VKTFFDRIEDLNIINMNLETPFELLKPRFWGKEVFKKINENVPIRPRYVGRIGTLVFYCLLDRLGAG